MKNVLKTILLFSLIFPLIFLISCKSCKSCKREAEPEVTISGDTLLLEVEEGEFVEKKDKEDSKIKRIEIGPRKEYRTPEPEAEEEVEYTPPKISALPPDTYEETDLSARLREKMVAAYDGQEEAIPDVKIYLSDMKYNEFVDYYKSLGYSVHTVAVPAKQVIEPVLEQRPEMASKINLADYEDVVIHQVMVDDAGISAADKYIDPDTFEVIDKTFVTKMNK